MKKKLVVFMSSIALFCVAATALMNAQSTDNSMGTLHMENVEALSEGEGGTIGICSYEKVVKDQKKHKLDCSGIGQQCCILD